MRAKWSIGRFCALAGALIVFFTIEAGRAATALQLFNGHDLAGWETWLGAAAKDSSPLGWNHDPKGVFTVVTLDGAPAIRCSGEICGSLVSQAAFDNFRLRVEYKWGERRWAPREKDQRDSGVFYHSNGSLPPPGGCWLAGSQCSLAEADSGDFWPIQVVADAEVRRLDEDVNMRPELEAWYRRNGVSQMPWQWQPGGSLRTFRDGLMNGHRADKPLGQWNVAEIICVGDRATHVINGQTNLVLLHLRRETEGKSQPLTRGRLQLQSEQAEIFFRHLELISLPAPDASQAP